MKTKTNKYRFNQVQRQKFLKKMWEKPKNARVSRLVFGDSWLTQEEASKMLNITPRKLSSYVRRCLIVSRIENGKTLYNYYDVYRLWRVNEVYKKVLNNPKYRIIEHE